MTTGLHGQGYFSVCQYKISCGKPGSIDIEVSNLGKYQLTRLLIG